MDWIEHQGGIQAIESTNEKKAALLYESIDNSSLYQGTAEVQDRSTMNVTFLLTSEELENQFIKEATEAGFMGLKGHRSVGGCRASIYNAMPLEGVEKLVEFMTRFEKKL